MEPALGRVSRPLPNGKTKQIVNKDVKMYRVQRSMEADGVRKGIVINVTDIWRPIDLIPVFGNECPTHWTSSTSIDLAKEFLVNRFFDKQTYLNVW